MCSLSEGGVGGVLARTCFGIGGRVKWHWRSEAAQGYVLAFRADGAWEDLGMGGFSLGASA